MGRRNGPTLYEAMSRVPPPSAAGDGEDSSDHMQDMDRPNPSPLLTPGRVVRVPVGYVWIAMGGLILLAVLAYMYGFSRGSSQAQADASRISAGLEQKLSEGFQVRDPLLNAAPEVRKPDRRPDNGDPRVPGMAYFIAETPLKERSMEIVTFIREQGQGLDAAIVPADNERLRQIIVLPGFKPSEAKTRDQLRKRIIELGRRFERIGKNNDNFDDTYFLTYKGPSN